MLLAVALVCLVTACYIPGLMTVRFHGDEASWIASSPIFEAVLAREFTDPAFTNPSWGLGGSPLARYLIGLGRSVGGYARADINGSWNWSVDAEANARAGHLPSDGLLWWSRLPMALLAVLAVTAGFVLVRAAGGSWRAASGCCCAASARTSCFICGVP